MSGPAPQQRGGQRTGIVEGWEMRGTSKQVANSGAWKGLAFVAIAVLLIVVGGWFVGRPYISSVTGSLFEEYPGIINVPIVSDLLAAELSDRINVPAGSGDGEVDFAIAPGATIDDIKAELAEQGLLTDPLAFQYLVVSDRVDQLVRAGEYTMTQDITPEGIVALLVRGPDPLPEVTVLDMRHGRRIEQITAYLQQQSEETDLELDAKEFQQLATTPTPAITDSFSFLKNRLPEGHSLEGFLAGGTYEVPVDISAEELIFQLLDQWEDESGGSVSQARKKNVDFYDMLTIASLVEREAKTDSDRAKIASAYWNRLKPKLNGDTGGLMQADPSVVYATDSVALKDIAVKKWDEYIFWDLLGLTDYSTVDVPDKYASFQTYQNAGLPDWPIVSPSAASIQAALNPAKGKNLFFYACEGSDTHKFAKTFAGHQRNINKCR
jgi:UPF0755 protein